MSREGGIVEHGPGAGGRLGDEVIGLAPYFLPTLTLLSLAVRPVVPPAWSTAFQVWLGATIGYHGWSTVHELRANFSAAWFPSAVTGELVQTDIGRRGRVYSAIFIGAGTLGAYGLSLAILLGGRHGAWGWARRVGSGVVDTAPWLMTRLASALA